MSKSEQRSQPFAQIAQVGVSSQGFRRDAQFFTAADRWDRVRGRPLDPEGD